MSTAAPPGEQRVLLHGVSWQTYERLVGEMDEAHGGVRLAYDEGALEIMSPTHAHDWIKRILGRAIETFSLARDIPIKSGGATTFKKEDLDKGIEPDECYWVQNEPRVRGKSDIDLAIDPPPDIAIEVEITRSSLNKHEIYAALGVPEIWRHDGATLQILTLTSSGTYEPAERSPALPDLPLDEVARLVARREEMDETSLFRAFWEQILRPGLEPR